MRSFAQGTIRLKRTEVAHHERAERVEKKSFDTLACARSLRTPFDSKELRWHTMSERSESNGGGGGNRTPVRELSTLTSTYLASAFKFCLTSLPEAGFSKGYLKKICSVSLEKEKRAILSESTPLCARQERALGTLAAIKQPGRNYNRLRLCLVLPFLRATIGTSVCS